MFKLIVLPYKEITDILNKNFSSIKEFVDVVYSSINNHNYENIIMINKKQKIKSERSKFKVNIFNHRKKLGLIDSWNQNYSDLCDDDNNEEGLIAKFNEAEAAHIIDVATLKEKYINENDDNYISLVSDPNNGLIMKHEYHKSFDRGQWYFDNNGYMIVPYENNEYLFKTLKLKKIKIRPEIFNATMKDFLKKQYNNFN